MNAIGHPHCCRWKGQDKGNNLAFVLMSENENEAPLIMEPTVPLQSSWSDRILVTPLQLYVVCDDCDDISSDEASTVKFLSHISLHFIKEDTDIEEQEEVGKFWHV